jgi:hypothetical protein
MSPDPVDDLPELARRALEAIVESPLAWCDATLVAIATAHGLAPTLDRLADLTRQGWVAPWPLPGNRVAFTLTPLAARRLRVHLVETGIAELPHWSAADKAHHERDPVEPRSPRTRPDFLTAAHLPPARIARPAPTPRRARRRARRK